MKKQFNIFKSYEPRRYIIPYCVGSVMSRNKDAALRTARRRWGSGLYRAIAVVDVAVKQPFQSGRNVRRGRE